MYILSDTPAIIKINCPCLLLEHHYIVARSHLDAMLQKKCTQQTKSEIQYYLHNVNLNIA